MQREFALAPGEGKNSKSSDAHRVEVERPESFRASEDAASHRHRNISRTAAETGSDEEGREQSHSGSGGTRDRLLHKLKSGTPGGSRRLHLSGLSHARRGAAFPAKNFGEDSEARIPADISGKQTHPLHRSLDSSLPPAGSVCGERNCVPAAT